MSTATQQRLATRRNGDGDPARIELGQDTYDVFPQTWPYLRKHLGRVFGNLDDMDLNADSMLDLIGARVYELLRVFVPNLMPRWKFDGYDTEEAWEADQTAGESDRINDESSYAPTVPQIRAAIVECGELNGLDLVKHLKNLLGPEMIRALIHNQMMDSMTSSSPTPSATSTADTPSTPSSATTPPTSSDTED